MHNNWLTIDCESCGKHIYSFEKVNKLITCECGCKELEMLDVDEWDASDFLHITKQELQKSGGEKYIGMIDGLYDRLEPVVADERRFAKTMRILSDEFFDLIEV